MPNPFGMRVNINGLEVVWRSQPRSCSSILRYALEAGSTRLARKMDTYITSAELPKMLERRDTSEPMHVRTCTHLLLFSANSISSHGDYSRAASIWSYTVCKLIFCIWLEKAVPAAALCEPFLCDVFHTCRAWQCLIFWQLRKVWPLNSTGYYY